MVGIACDALAFGWPSALFGATLAARRRRVPITAIRAGRLLDPEAGRILANQIILVEGTRIRDVGPNVAIPPARR